MTETAKGAAWPFWLRAERARVAAGMGKRDLANKAEVARTTLDGLRTGSRPPKPDTVHRIADVLGIPRDEAEQLAGLVPTEPAGTGADLRDAIRQSAVLTDAQRDALIQMVDAFDAANRTANPDSHNRAG